MEFIYRTKVSRFLCSLILFSLFSQVIFILYLDIEQNGEIIREEDKRKCFYSEKEGAIPCNDTGKVLIYNTCAEVLENLILRAKTDQVEIYNILRSPSWSNCPQVPEGDVLIYHT